MALNLKRKNGGGPVSAYDDAIMTYMMLGDGVLDGVYGSFKGSWSSGVFSIQPGIILYGGRVIEIEKGSPLQISVPASDLPTLIWLEVTIASDDSQSTVRIYASRTVNRTTATPAAGDGTYREYLFRIGSDYLITEFFDRIEPGVAKSCKNLLSGGYINGVAFSDVFDSSLAAKHALEATTADEASGFIGGSKNAVSSNLYMPNRGVYLLQQADLLTGASVTNLSADGTTTIPFADSNSLSRNEGIVAVYAGTNGSKDRIDYGGAYVEQGGSFRISDELEARIYASGSYVWLHNISSSAVSASGIGMSVLLYGGAA